MLSATLEAMLLSHSSQEFKNTVTISRVNESVVMRMGDRTISIVPALDRATGKVTFEIWVDSKFCVACDDALAAVQQSGVLYDSHRATAYERTAAYRARNP